MFIVFVSSSADCQKDRQFLKLNEMNMEEKVAVIRGKFGATQSISMWDLVVGDIVLLSQGSRAPADCIIIESSDLKIVEHGQSLDNQ